MLGILEIFILLNIEYVFIECLIPHLNVRKLDKKFIAQKRQDTLDMCRIFNAETEKMKYYTPMLEKHHDIEKKHNRSKRSVVPVNIVNPALNDEDADRIEKIVDKIYDDLQENGEGVAYRQPKNQASASKHTPNKAARRFNFAPSELVGPDERHLPQKAIKDQPAPSGKIPRFKYGVVPYFIDSRTYDLHLSEIIVKAFDYIEKATCIRLQRLRERPTDTDSLRNVTWIYITNPLGIRQCVHSNERIDIQGVQMIVFGYDCMSLGGIIHEIMHVLGFSHEHSRPDRDQYITILWENIKPGYKKYFEIIDNSAVESLPYDYASVLHYPSRAFSRNGQVTILTEPGIKVGQREGFSELDVEKINTLYSAECVKRNREYLLKTCPVVVKAGTPTQKNMTEDDIYDFFKDRLWLYGIVNYRIKDKIEFTSEERENINAVISHIEKETCIEFRDVTPDSDENSDDSSDEDDEIDLYLNANATQNSTVKEKQMIYSLVKTTLDGEIPNQSANEINMSDNDLKGTTVKDRSRRMKNTVGSFRKRNGLTEGHKQNTGSRAKRGAVRSPLRRHMNNVIVLTRSAEPGCVCPPPGKPDGVKVLNINSDCFNSVNDLLHLFVHVLGLDHQHNMHDRDSYLHIVWDELTPDIRDEMRDKLPPAASVGFPYDYQSVMHYPWLQIKNGRTNMMYPIWNDGWAMGHWQGLSSTDVQKLNVLYNEQCAERKRLAANAGKSK